MCTPQGTTLLLYHLLKAIMESHNIIDSKVYNLATSWGYICRILVNLLDNTSKLIHVQYTA